MRPSMRSSPTSTAPALHRHALAGHGADKTAGAKRTILKRKKRPCCLSRPGIPARESSAAAATIAFGRMPARDAEARCIDRVVAIEFELDELSIEVIELRKEPVEQVGGSRNLRRRRIRARKALDAWHGVVTTVGCTPAFGSLFSLRQCRATLRWTITTASPMSCCGDVIWKRSLRRPISRLRCTDCITSIESITPRRVRLSRLRTQRSTALS